jgi:hypothetical protein
MWRTLQRAVSRFISTFFLNVPTHSCAPCRHAGFSDIVGLMRAILALGLAVSLAVQSQTLSGTVVDIDGKPLEGVRIDHASMLGFGDRTSDRDGHLAIATNGHLVVLRKPGYQGQLVPSSATDLRIVLKSATKEFAVCKTLRGYNGISDGKPGLYFPKLDGVSARALENGDDFGYRNYVVAGKIGRNGITHGRGPAWSFGIPTSMDVWESAEYSDISYPEISFMQGHTVIVDARGKTRNGRLWRYLGFLGESAFYRDVDEPTARILDRVIDGACLLPR